MPKQITLHDQIIRGMERLGYRRDTSVKAMKYDVFIDHIRGDGRRVYVGRQQAVRGGKTLAASIPLDRLKVDALAKGA